MHAKQSLPNLNRGLISGQVRRVLIREMETGIFQDAEKLPSELELCRQLGVSRTVVRDALSSMEEDGLVTRARGVGTVINHAVVGMKNRLDRKLEYGELIARSHFKPQTDGVRLREENADERTAGQLGIPPGTRLLVCEKRVLAGETPVIYSSDRLPASLFSGMDIQKIDWGRPIFTILEKSCGIKIVENIARLTATNADPLIRGQLNLKPGKALYRLDEVGRDAERRPILSSVEYYTDFFRFSLLRKRKS